MYLNEGIEGSGVELVEVRPGLEEHLVGARLGGFPGQQRGSPTVLVRQSKKLSELCYIFISFLCRQ